MNEAENGRFSGVARLYGTDSLARLRQAHVCVVGVGGVGSWTVEALARSGVGALTLVDLDEICVTNINRQIHALDATVGRAKVAVMAERVRAINPDCQLTVVQEFFTEANGARLLETFAADSGTGAQHVVDAIDGVTNKALLIALCRQRKLPLVVCGGAGGRRDATAVRMADLADASNDRLLTALRRRLRAEHGFPAAGQPMGVACVYSPESPVAPDGPATDCAATALDGPAPRLNCDWGYGSAVFVTGVFGFAAAAQVVRQIAEAPGGG